MAKTRYLYIQPIQEPGDLGTDEAGYVHVGFNVSIWKRPSGTVLRELKTLLAGVATSGSTLFTGTKAVIPTGAGPYLVVTETPGAPPVFTQNEAPAYQRPSAQLVAMGKDYEATLALARAAYNALVAVRNVDVTVA